MKKTIHSLSHGGLLLACLLAGTAGAQTITLSGDSSPSGSLGASYDGTEITVGNTGAGRMEVLSGARLNNSRQTLIGQAAGSTGTALLSGGSRWTAIDVTVGRFGSGELTINAGASLESAQGYIGRLAGSSGTVTVEGPGASWSIPITRDVDFWIGNAGTGTLRVLDGATVSTTSDIYTSNDVGGTALIEVDGANSSLSALQRCYLGAIDLTTINIRNGGMVQCGIDSYLRIGHISVSGAGSRWVSTASLDIGRSSNRSRAVLTIGDGSTVQVAEQLLLPNVRNASLTDTGTLNIEGATTPGALTANQIRFGINGMGVINFQHSDASGNYLFATPVSGPGAVNVSNGGTTSLTGNNQYTGLTTIDAGVLRAGSATGLSSASDYVVGAGGTLDSDSYSPTVRSLSNAGTVTMLAAGATGVLTVANNYVGNGGSIAMNTVLGADDAATERLVVDGDTSGTTVLNISNLGGTGAQTRGDGILVVQVAGASNGSFRLPAPGTVRAGEFEYALVQVGNNWYLQSQERAEASGPSVSMACTPAELGDSDNQVATCTVRLSDAPATALSINMVLPTAHPRYTTTCTSPIVIAANTTDATCTITAVPNTTPNDGDVTVALSIAPPTVPDAYVVDGGPALVVVIDDDIPRPVTRPHAVPTMGGLGLVAMASLMGLMGWRRSRQHRARQG